MCSVVMLHQCSLAVFLLCSLVTLDGRPVAALSSRTKRSVSHAQLMHDKSRSLQEFKRGMWLQELLEEVHTVNERAVHSRIQIQTFSGNTLHEKPPGATKNLPTTFSPDIEGPALPQETNKAVAYKDQPLKVATKRKKRRGWAAIERATRSVHVRRLSQPRSREGLSDLVKTWLRDSRLDGTALRHGHRFSVTWS
uniref:Parathyroid hormone-like hormone b n=1 Tax=Gasterosteus aculeatus aculeatus TaxID=481459 RepID=A0AAQ4QFR1_GASAC